MASRVGVVPPGAVAAMEAATAGPFAAAIPTAGARLASQALLSGKYLIPQFTFASFAPTTLVMAAETCDHFELAPQPVLAQDWSLSSLFIDPDLSCTMRMSGRQFI